MNIDVDAVLIGYLGCALWTGTDEHGEPLDKTFGSEDFDEKSRSLALRQCEAFCDENKDALQGIDPTQIGHDLWLTRNGHGAGFWDRGLEEVGEALSESAKGLGEQAIFVDGNQLVLE
jgi:hypothetical protein